MLPAAKHMIAITPKSGTTGEVMGGTLHLPIDTLGYDFCSVTVFAGTTDTTSNALTVLQLKEADVTNTSSFANISGAVSGTDYTVATTAYATTSNQNIWTFNVDCRGRKRYLRVYATVSTTQLVAGLASLYRGEQAPVTAAKANVLNLINI